MDLIKVGECTVNLDKVANTIYREPPETKVPTISLYLTTGEYLVFQEQEAEALRWWLGTKATNIEKRYEEQQEREEQTGKVSSWEARFTRFCDDRTIPEDSTRYGYQMFLRNNAPFGSWREPNEETFLEFQSLRNW